MLDVRNVNGGVKLFHVDVLERLDGHLIVEHEGRV